MASRKRKIAQFARAVGDVFSAMRTLVEWCFEHRFFAVVLVGVVFLLSVSQLNRRGEYYFRTPEETKYLCSLRQKYAGAQKRLTVAETKNYIAKGCGFLATAKGGAYAYDTPAARDLLLGTAIVESDLRPRFQDSDGDAIGLFQIEYGTYRDTLERVLKKNNPQLYESLVENFAATKGKILFEDLQTNSALAAIFARLKYAQTKESLPNVGDYEAQGHFYKDWYNTHSGLGRVGVFVEKRQAADEL